MSGLGTLPGSAEADVLQAVLSRLRSDSGIGDLFGAPARVFDDETGPALFPNIRVERHETRDAGVSCVAGQEHRILLAIASRHGGRAFAKRAMGAVRTAITDPPLSVPDQNIELQQIVYSDVLRTQDRQRFRGLIQLRIITEEVN